MVYFLRIVILLVWVAAAFPASAMPHSSMMGSEMTQTRLTADRTAIQAGEPFWLALEMVLSPDWHSYWENPGDTGMTTTMRWELPEGFTAGPIHWPIPKRVELAGLMNFAYEGIVYFPVPITPPKDLPAGDYYFRLKANWLVCKDICIPESGEYTLMLPVGQATDDPNFMHPHLAALPKPLKNEAQYSLSANTLTLSIPQDAVAPYKGMEATLFPLTDGLIDNMAEQKTVWDDKGLSLSITRGASTEAPPLKGLITFASGITVEAGFMFTAEAASLPAASAETDLSLALALLLAFAGGLVLNLMPCVLPILSLKALALVKKSSASRREASTHGIAYTGGILASFAAVAGLLILLQQAGSAVGWGFQLQSAGFVTFLALVTFVVGLNLSGVFTVPHLLGSAGNTLAARKGAVGSFFTGVLAVLVATPCTAPFMAPALGFALTQPPLQAFLIFQALALGFAAPLLLVSLSPRLIAFLPKPGAWMQAFKQLMAFPMYATSAWLLWVLTRQGGEQALAEGLTLLVSASFLLWLHEHMKNRLAHQMFHIGLAVFTVFFAWLLLSGPGALPEVKQEPFSQERLTQLRTENTPVFVYATADWCITCKINEASSLRTSTVMEHFHKEGIVMMEADWTNRDEHISEYLASFNRQGVPLYVFYPKENQEPRLLPQLLTPYLLVDETQP